MDEIYLNRHFTKENIQMSSRHIKRCLVSYVTRELLFLLWTWYSGLKHWGPGTVAQASNFSYSSGWGRKILSLRPPGQLTSCLKNKIKNSGDVARWYNSPEFSNPQTKLKESWPTLKVVKGAHQERNVFTVLCTSHIGSMSGAFLPILSVLF